MAKRVRFFSMLLLFAFMIQSSLALETERKSQKLINNTYEFSTIKPRGLFNTTFNKSKIAEPPRIIFNPYSPKRWGYYIDRNKNRNRNKASENSKTITCNNGYKFKCKNNKHVCSCKCSYKEHLTCYKKICFCQEILGRKGLHLPRNIKKFKIN